MQRPPTMISSLRLLPLLAALSLLLAHSALAQLKGIQASPHDFSYVDWNTEHGVCAPCHQAHNTAPAQSIPLWSHLTSAGPFTPYDSPTMDADAQQPSGPSLACLSCHDGTLAINQLIPGLMGEEPDYIGGHKVGPDIHDMHPVSIIYDSALAAKDGSLENPSVYRIGDPKIELTVSTAPVPTSWSGTSLTGKTLDQAMLFNSRVECSSCHDVHKLHGSAPSNRRLLRINGRDTLGRDDLLCRTCHIK